MFFDYEFEHFGVIIIVSFRVNNIVRVRGTGGSGVGVGVGVGGVGAVGGGLYSQNMVMGSWCAPYDALQRPPAYGKSLEACISPHRLHILRLIARLYISTLFQPLLNILFRTFSEHLFIFKNRCT